MEFPRLYFLSDEDLVELLGISRNPKALLPFAKMCFPGIETLNFALPDGISSMNTALDFALNGMGAIFICNLFTGNTLQDFQIDGQGIHCVCTVYLFV